MDDFISKEFECRNHTTSDNKTVNSIVDFLRTLDDKIEIENKNGKRVNAKSFIKMMGLNIKYGDCFTLYVYGDNRENNIKRIEEILEKKEFYTLDKIEELEKLKESEEDKLIEEEIFYLTPNDKKESVKNDLKNKIKLIKEKRNTLHLETLNLDNSILYIKNNDKTEIVNIINNNVYDIIKQLSSHYEIPIKENKTKDFLSHLISIVKGKEMKYFYIYLFFNDIKKYFYNQFDSLFIKKIIGIENLEIEYNTSINNNFVEESIKTLDYILEDKRKSAEYSIDIYMIADTSNIAIDVYRIINIVQNIGKIYEIKTSITDNIIDKIKEHYETSNHTYINTAFHDEEYLDNIKEFKDYLQNTFENIYKAKQLENEENIDIDYKYIIKMARRL